MVPTSLKELKPFLVLLALGFVFIGLRVAGILPDLSRLGAPGPGKAAAGPGPADLLKRMGEGPLPARQAAARQLMDLASEEPGLPPGFDLVLLKAAARPWPADALMVTSAPGVLVDAAGIMPRAEQVPVIEEHFEKYEPDARLCALLLLARIPDPAGARAFLARAGSLAADPEQEARLLGVLGPSAQASPLLEPWVVERLAVPRTFMGAARILLRQADGLKVKFADPARVLAPTEAHLRATLATLAGPATGPERDVARAEAAAAADLLGELPKEGAAAALEAGLACADPWVRAFVAVSRIRLGLPVEAAYLESVAAWPGSRSVLFDRLEELGLAARFPAAWAAPARILEGRFARWLAYPTELGAALGAVELMDQSEEVGAGLQLERWYVLRFKALEPDPRAATGWMAGVFGPLAKDGSMLEVGAWGTGSDYQAWDSATPAQHRDRIRKGIEARWAAQQAEGS